MEADHFASFRKSGWYKQWQRSEAAGFYQTREISEKCLRMAYAIWQEAHEQCKADRRRGDKSRFDGLEALP
jgi:hypothetical protein